MCFDLQSFRIRYCLFLATLVVYPFCDPSLGICQTSSLSQAGPSAPPVLLQMIRDDLVHQDLGLTGAQRDSLREVLLQVDGRWFRARNLPAAKQQQELTALTALLRQRLAAFFSDTQMTRLDQLERQALGTRMLMLNKTAKLLGVSEEEQKRFIDAFIATDAALAEIQEKLRSGEFESDEAQRKMTALQDAERGLLADRLTQQQRSKIGEATGKPFDFSKVQRMYPLAPELTTDGVTWVQGGPLKLEQLRGKVVAVHYYAYQCINCKRNLPHYTAWYADYVDKGLVVVGIQTPETASERNFAKVKAAAQAEGIRYPVLLDGESANWRTWSNTMWPTVYLIDKEGYLRRWWQGEMNWQGKEGEKDMRRTIEQLLAE
ncbi:MAG: redoxin domain-containing protein [Pirellulaceae bacterium]|nr:redoxin domain-containing protein [Pirellulaceae bacterium]